MKMPFRDFAPRRRRFQLPSEPLSRAEGTGALLKALELSQRAGAVIQPIADEFRIPVDFKSGSNGRVDLETGTYVLLAASASQRSRLENLIPRMLSRIRTAGLPIQAMEVRIRPRRQAHESERTPAEAPRPVEKSISGAAALREEAARTQNEDLARELRELARWVTPSDAEFPSVFSAALGRDLMRASEAIERMQRTLEAMPATPDPKLVPSEAAAAADPQLARLRARMIERGAELERAKTPIADLLGEFDDAIARAVPWIEAPDDPARPTLEAEYLDWRKHLAALLEAVDDAVRAAVLREEELPKDEIAVLGGTTRERINTMISSIYEHSNGKNCVQMGEREAAALESLRSFMFERVYITEQTKKEEERALRMLSAMYSYFTAHTEKLPAFYRSLAEEAPPSQAVCDYLSSMTDKFAVAVFENLFVPRSWALSEQYLEK